MARMVWVGDLGDHAEQGHPNTTASGSAPSECPQQEQAGPGIGGGGFLSFFFFFFGGRAGGSRCRVLWLGQRLTKNDGQPPGSRAVGGDRAERGARRLRPMVDKAPRDWAATRCGTSA